MVQNLLPENDRLEGKQPHQKQIGKKSHKEGEIRKRPGLQNISRLSWTGIKQRFISWKVNSELWDARKSCDRRSSELEKHVRQESESHRRDQILVEVRR